MKKLFTLICLFIFSSVMGQTNWTKYPSNPVIKRDTLNSLSNDLIAISDSWVIKEGVTYKMWYTCGGANYPIDTFLRSRICYCESTDGITWTKYSGNPVLDVSHSGVWDSLGVETASVIIDSSASAGQRYKMWYAGQYFNSYRYDIGYAYSADGKHWNKHPVPILKVGSQSQWDDGFIEGPSVIKDGSIYKMWYAGYSLVDGKVNIGYATSQDGIIWAKHPNNPVLRTSATGWDKVYVQDPHVIKIGSTYYMWYGGADQNSNYGQQTGYAYSSDGINWIKSAANPVLKKGSVNSWDANTASFGSVILDGGKLKMWYTGKDIDPIPTNSLRYYWELGFATDSTFAIGANSTHSFFIYPNPGSSILNIKENNSTNEKRNLMIINCLGQKVMTAQIQNSESHINISNLSNGLYFVEIFNGEKKIYSRKIVISK